MTFHVFLLLSILMLSLAWPCHHSLPEWLDVFRDKCEERPKGIREVS